MIIGHWQGTYLLRELIRWKIDRRPPVRRRLASALLLGGGADWSLHLVDVYLAYGNLVDVVERQARAYLRKSAASR